MITARIYSRLLFWIIGDVSVYGSLNVEGSGWVGVGVAGGGGGEEPDKGRGEEERLKGREFLREYW